MSKTYLISDTHLGHRGIQRLRPRFQSEEDHHEHVFEGMSRLTKYDTLYLLGDIAFTEDWLARLGTLACNLQVFLGNHDFSANKLKQYLRKGKYEIHCFKSKHRSWLSHCPIHPMEIRNRRFNIHGHTHYVHMLDEEGVPDPRYINVCCEYTNYQPITIEHATSQEFYYTRVSLHSSPFFQSMIPTNVPRSTL